MAPLTDDELAALQALDGIGPDQAASYSHDAVKLAMKSLAARGLCRRFDVKPMGLLIEDIYCITPAGREAMARIGRRLA